MGKKFYKNSVGTGKYTGLLLIMPFVAGLVLFTAIPLGMSFAGSVSESGTYTEVLQSSDFYKSMAVTLKYVLILVPLKLVVSLAVALILSISLRFMGVYRTIFYIPSVLGSNLSVVIMWQFLFTSDGPVNKFLNLINIESVGWYSDSRHALSIIILLRLWEFGSSMIIFLNALKNIPSEYYDCAKTDGCGKVRAFFLITLPLLRDSIFLNLILQTISAFQEFNAPYLLTGGGPMKSTRTVGMLIYDEMFRYGETGYANAVSWILFAVITIAIILIWKIGRRGSEEF